MIGQICEMTFEFSDACSSHCAVAVFAYVRNASLSSFIAIGVGIIVFTLLFLGAGTVYLRR